MRVFCILFAYFWNFLRMFSMFCMLMCKLCRFCALRHIFAYNSIFAAYFEHISAHILCFLCICLHILRMYSAYFACWSLHNGIFYAYFMHITTYLKHNIFPCFGIFAACVCTFYAYICILLLISAYFGVSMHIYCNFEHTNEYNAYSAGPLNEQAQGLSCSIPVPLHRNSFIWTDHCQ